MNFDEAKPKDYEVVVTSSTGGKDEITTKKSIDIIPKKTNNDNYSKALKFSSNWLNEYCKKIYEHTPSGYLQIEIKALQNIAYLFCYGGLRTEPFYILDLCPSGTGKSENIKHQSELLLSPVYSLQTEKLTKDIERYKIKVKSEKNSKDKEIVDLPKLHKCIHSNDTSKEALFESFESTSSQMIEFGELGLRLKKTDPTLDYIVDGYGRNKLSAPNFKNQRFSSKISVANISLFFMGDTNLSYLGKQTFYNHLQGGLINRCFIVYDDYIPEYEELPSNYYQDLESIQKYNGIANNIITFSNEYSSIKISKDYFKNPILTKYEKLIHDRKKELMHDGVVFGNLYHRAIQNLRAIVNLLHLIKCFDDGETHYSVSDKTIEEGIAFCKRYFNFDKLINELNGSKSDDILDIKKQKVINKINEMKLPCSIRDVYRSVNMSKKELISIINGKYKFNAKQILASI